MSLAGAIARTKAIFTSPKFDHDWARFMWDKYKEGATRSLGTFREAEKTLSELARYNNFNRDTSTPIREHTLVGNMQEKFSEDLTFRHKSFDDIVGDPKDVHHIIPPQHAIGYSIEVGKDGYSMETIETLRNRFFVLRHHGRLVGAADEWMLRMESLDNIMIS